MQDTYNQTNYSHLFSQFDKSILNTKKIPKIRIDFLKYEKLCDKSAKHGAVK